MDSKPFKHVLSHSRSITLVGSLRLSASYRHSGSQKSNKSETLGCASSFWVGFRLLNAEDGVGVGIAVSHMVIL